MYTIVAAAKALYDQLGVMGEMSIDGDSFLDLWIYVILKANVKDLVGSYPYLIPHTNVKDLVGSYPYPHTSYQCQELISHTNVKNLVGSYPYLIPHTNVKSLYLIPMPRTWWAHTHTLIRTW